MPIVPFESLPDNARVWVFASDQPLSGAVADTLLAAVDRFLAEWKAHGVPLPCARDWRDDRFLAIAVDVNTENASGCSIDGLFRTLQQLERSIGTRLADPLRASDCLEDVVACVPQRRRVDDAVVLVVFHEENAALHVGHESSR